MLMWINNDQKGEADVVGKVSNAILPEGLKYERGVPGGQRAG